MRHFNASALAVLSVFLCSAVMAATVKPVEGEVFINRGNGYERVLGVSHAKVGDFVMARPGGSARVVYDDNCSITVRPGNVVAIAPDAPCNKTASFDPNTTRMNAGIAPGKGFEEPPPRHHHWLPYAIIGGIAIPVGLCIAEEHICDNEASP